VNAAVSRIDGVLHLGPRVAWALVLIGFVGLAGMVAAATRIQMLPLGLLGAVGALVVAVTFRWPILGRAAFAALIPIEGVLLIEGVGTLSRFAGILFAVTYGVPRMGRLAFGAMPTAGWALLAWTIVSVGWAIDPGIAAGQLFTLIQLFVIALLIADYVVHEPGIVRPILWVYSLSAAVTSVIGIVSYGGADARSAALEGQNPAQFAAVLLPALVFGAYEMFNRERRLLGGAIAFITTVGLLVSGTRGAWLAALVVLPIFVLPNLTPRRRIAFIAGIVVLGVLALQVPGIAAMSVERIETALSSGGAGRTDIWAVGATIYAANPVLGVGYANFPVAYTPDVVRATGVLFYTHSGAAPHNLVVGTIVELGPVGLLLVGLFLGPLLVRRGWGPEGSTIQASLAALLVLSLFLDMLANHKELWLVIGLAAGLAFRARAAIGAKASGGSGAIPVATVPGLPPHPVLIAREASVRPVAERGPSPSG
jgi:O-antigen ligase